MDIRKFFGAQSSAKKSGSLPPKPSPMSGKIKNSKDDKISATKKGEQKKSSFKKAKSVELKEEDVVIVDDFIDSQDVVKDSQEDKNKNKIDKQSRSISAEKKSSSSSRSKRQPVEKNTKELSKDTKKNVKKDSDCDSDIDIFSSAESATTNSSKKTKEKPVKKTKDSKLPAQTSKPGKGDKTSDEQTDRRLSPRKHSSIDKEVKRETKSRKRIQVSSDEEEGEDEVKVSDSDPEEVLVSRRKRCSKGKQGLKKPGRMLDSDSGEDPFPSEKPQKKRKKKEPVVFIDESDEEKKVTALDKFVIHNATPVQPQKKVKALDKDKKDKTPVNIADFFGSGTTSRSNRTVAVAKRKCEDLDKVEKEILYDEEIHDDDDFVKTLDLLDGPNIKKTKTEEVKSEEKDQKPSGGLASKLAAKVQALKESTTNQNEKSEIQNSNVSIKSPDKKLQSPKAKTTSVKKGKVYTMEVSRTQPATVVISPNKSKAKEDKTPPKNGDASPKGKQSSVIKASSAEKNDTDDGFGPKGIAGFRAFKNREGPQALGSKEIPEGEENCMEGLTFVITGILDSIERDEAKTLVEKHGGRVTGSISRKTSFIVVGRDAGNSKLTKAQELKVKQVNEDGLFDLVRSLPGKKSKYEIQAEKELKKESSIKVNIQKGAAAKLESFRCDKDKTNPSTSSSAQKSLFTLIKDTANATTKSTPEQLDQSESFPKKSKDPDISHSESLLWVDKHKPASLKQIIGQQGDKSNARKLLQWLKAWHQNIIVKGLKPTGNMFGRGDGTGCRAALLSGPPGIGKTTTATLVCKDLGFSFVELNASDTRSKRNLKEVVAESLNNQTLVDYMGDDLRGGPPTGQFHCVIMDEVDGMAGNEDRGGLQELVQLIKTSKIPIICICNDRNSMKMRTLSGYCLDLRFQRPRVEQIKGAMMSLAFKEGLKIPPVALQEIILASNHDIRQIINNMAMWSAADKSMTLEQVKKDAQKAQKDLRIGPFDVCRKVFVNNEETQKMTIHDKSDLFFQDYSFGPLFVHENYPHVIPNKANGNHARHLSCLARTIDSLCDSDIIDKLIRKDGNWSLLPTQAMFASVIPGEVMRGSLPQMAAFPQWLGKHSSTGKTQRILQELTSHMRLEVSCDKHSLNLDYLPTLRTRLTSPLVSKGSEGVPEVIKVMDDYDIVKEDFDNMLDVTKWPNSVDPMAKLDTKTKAAFTRQYNKEIHKTPYATGVVSKKRKARGAAMDESEIDVEGGDGEGGNNEMEGRGESEDEEDERLEADTMIKTKKPRGKASSQQAGSSKAGGKGQGGKGKR